ncbi:SLC13 family permease [Myroides odoratimimus]|uniref:SLC13 family permease n=1 Tax=Myroides TaxID=76831 RepID=UPI0008F4D456|nr:MULTISPECIES: SLC13 family permease [Myroides]APA91504.1 transporter [Myroides sp. ZB35]MCO7722021.1 SLC13 family permease [Myroides odoratimimus]MEC4051591.1 SLC13 family permease [Myroides odoratimimus]SHL15851.1 solute carrier family 13 (sodium-dependent dicarboxylate transporter), member 2/3/5 [Myroides odoratimimus subsp. xuanwuensis]
MRLDYEHENRPLKSKRNYLIILFNIITLLLLINYLPYEPQVNKGLALLVFVAVLWLTEAIHVTTTAVFVPVLAIGLGLTDTKPALASFADPTIFLFLGGFVLAGALHVQKLDMIIANKIMYLAKGRLSYAVFYLFLATAVLSMWISNTATVAMMLPLVIGVLGQLDKEKYRSTYVFVLLGIAYSASIGGMGTVVGSPPNAIVASQLNISFAEWMKMGIPMVLILLPLMIGVIYFVFKPKLDFEFKANTKKIPMTSDRWLTLAIFITTALCWIFSDQLNPLVASLVGFESKFSNFDTFIALGAFMLICVSQVSRWKELQHNVDWGVLLLFGGGLTLSMVLRDSGASEVLADLLVSVIKDSSYFTIGLVVSFFIVFLTEFTSNTASAALLVPLFITISDQLGLPPLGLSMIIGLGASCAFMLPVATPPNAIVFGTGDIRQKDMMKAGFVLNIICAVLIAIIAYFFWLQ